MSSSSSVDRRAVDCKASPAGSVFGSANDVILFLAWGKATAEAGPRLSFSSQVQEWIDSNKHFLEGDIEMKIHKHVVSCQVQPQELILKSFYAFISYLMKSLT